MGRRRRRRRRGRWPRYQRRTAVSLLAPCTLLHTARVRIPVPSLCAACVCARHSRAPWTSVWRTLFWKMDLGQCCRARGKESLSSSLIPLSLCLPAPLSTPALALSALLLRAAPGLTLGPGLTLDSPPIAPPRPAPALAPASVSVPISASVPGYRTLSLISNNARSRSTFPSMRMRMLKHAARYRPCPVWTQQQATSHQ